MIKFFNTIISSNGEISIITNAENKLQVNESQGISCIELSINFHHFLPGTLWKMKCKKENLEKWFHIILEDHGDIFQEFVELLMITKYYCPPKNSFSFRRILQDSYKSTKDTCENNSCKSILVAKNIVSKIIGKRGCRINQIRSQTTASIIILDKNTKENEKVNFNFNFNMNKKKKNIAMQRIVVSGNEQEVDRTILTLKNEVRALFPHLGRLA